MATLFQIPAVGNWVLRVEIHEAQLDHRVRPPADDDIRDRVEVLNVPLVEQARDLIRRIAKRRVIMKSYTLVDWFSTGRMSL